MSCLLRYHKTKGLGAVAENLLAKTPKEIAIPSILLFKAFARVKGLLLEDWY